MLPKHHIALGFLASLAAYYLFDITHLQTIIIFLSSFLIDFDHYLNYVIRNKDYSLKNASAYFHNYRERWIKLSIHERKKFKRPIFIFHGIECWIVLYLLSYYHWIFLFSLFGIAIHIILDYIDYIYFNEPLYPKFSQLYLYLTNKNKSNFNY